jgi:ABC-type glycerol-3-phosphate transport system permease component
MIKRKSILVSGARYLIAIAILVATVFPFFWMLRVSLLPTGSISNDSLYSTLTTLTNYVDLFNQMNMGRYLFNSFFVGIVVTMGNILFCFMVAYTLARYQTLTNRFLFVSIIAVLMIPAHVTIIPLYLMCLKAGLYDSYTALIVPFLVNPIGIFLVKQYIESIPPSMEEAARVDGAGELTILFRVVMPVCKPALAVLAIQVFFTNWNSFFFPYILTQSDRVRTLPVGLAMFQGHQAIDWQHLMAGSTMAVVPVLVLFAFLQRRIVSGITAGAIKQ